MARRMLLVAGATTLFALAIPAVPAAAGGGCHEPSTTGTGDTVEMSDACFTPSTLRIDPGGSVTFVNRDPIVHNVTANGWGFFEDITRGDAFTATFEESGIFPYACAYHPGMTGAIVVGDGTGAGNGQIVSVSSVTPPSPQVVVRTVASPAASSRDSAAGWIGGGAIGLVLGAGAGLVVRRRGRGERLEGSSARG